MNVFEAVKDSVTAKEAAQIYGIKVDRSGKALCPFHNDRHPSMKLDKRFHCFACQADGDVIDFTAKLFGLSAGDAAVKLAHDFNISYDDGENSPPIPSSDSREESDDRKFLDAKRKCITVYQNYLSLLQKWRVECAPKTPEEEWDPCFIEALQEKEHVEYLLDVLMNGTLEEVADLIIDVGKEVNDLEKRVEEFSA